VQSLRRAKGRPQYAERPSGIKNLFAMKSPFSPGLAILSARDRSSPVRKLVPKAEQHHALQIGHRSLRLKKRNASTASGEERRAAVGEPEIRAGLVSP
jgi:hypothetical protein